MSYEPYLDQGLTSFEDIINAFTKFKDGGYWVKKIVKKGGFHREIVEGPYKKLEAENEARDWNQFFKFKDLIVAEIFTFFTLCCDFELDIRKKEYFYTEHIWQPPEGTDMFCLIYKPENAIIKKSININDKVYNYVKSNDIASIEVYNETIFYNSHNYKSRVKAQVLKRICLDYISLQREKEILLNYMINNKLENNFISIPNYITEFKNSCFSIYLSQFKEFIEDNTSCKNKIKKFYDKNYKCLPKENLHLDNNDIVLHIYLLLSKRDYQAKLIKIKKHHSYEIIIGDDEYYIKLTDIEKCNAILKIALPKSLEDFTNNYAQGDKKFQEVKNFIGLILYIAKCLGIDKIEYNSDQQLACICSNEGIFLYEEIISLLARKDSFYKKLGFINSKEKELEEIINNHRDMLTRQVLEKEDEEDLFLDKTISEVAEDYLNGICNFEYGCYLLDKINKFIYPKIKNYLNYTLLMKDKNLKSLRSMF